MSYSPDVNELRQFGAEILDAFSSPLSTVNQSVSSAAAAKRTGGKGAKRAPRRRPVKATPIVKAKPGRNAAKVTFAPVQLKAEGEKAIEVPDGAVGTSMMSTFNDTAQQEALNEYPATPMSSYGFNETAEVSAASQSTAGQSDGEISSPLGLAIDAILDGLGELSQQQDEMELHLPYTAATAEREMAQRDLQAEQRAIVAEANLAKMSPQHRGSVGSHDLAWRKSVALNNLVQSGSPSSLTSSPPTASPTPSSPANQNTMLQGAYLTSPAMSAVGLSAPPSVAATPEIAPVPMHTPPGSVRVFRDAKHLDVNTITPVVNRIVARSAAKAKPPVPAPKPNIATLATVKTPAFDSVLAPADISSADQRRMQSLLRKAPTACVGTTSPARQRRVQHAPPTTGRRRGTATPDLTFNERRSRFEPSFAGSPVLPTRDPAADAQAGDNIRRQRPGSLAATNVDGSKGSASKPRGAYGDLRRKAIANQWASPNSSAQVTPLQAPRASGQTRMDSPATPSSLTRSVVLDVDHELSRYSSGASSVATGLDVYSPVAWTDTSLGPMSPDLVDPTFISNTLLGQQLQASTVIDRIRRVREDAGMSTAPIANLGDTFRNAFTGELERAQAEAGKLREENSDLKRQHLDLEVQLQQLRTGQQRMRTKYRQLKHDVVAFKSQSQANIKAHDLEASIISSQAQSRVGTPLKNAASPTTVDLERLQAELRATQQAYVTDVALRDKHIEELQGELREMHRQYSRAVEDVAKAKATMREAFLVEHRDKMGWMNRCEASQNVNTQLNDAVVGLEVTMEETRTELEDTRSELQHQTAMAAKLRADLGQQRRMEASLSGKRNSLPPAPGIGMPLMLAQATRGAASESCLLGSHGLANMSGMSNTSLLSVASAPGNMMFGVGGKAATNTTTGGQDGRRRRKGLFKRLRRGRKDE